jgi:ABC-type polysaccharide/polyol phosphate transport system ATPase subunit
MRIFGHGQRSLAVPDGYPHGVSEVPPAVVVDGVSKSFRLPHERVHTLKERTLHPLSRRGHDALRALRDVSFVVERGEFFGIVGRNGSGKSTLLKCLAGIYGTDQGDIYVNGRMSTFIELGVGFNPDLPARDNVMLNATMLGLSPREARRRFDTIIDFAELQEFTDLKLKNYSSGMLVRLAFSVMVQVDADILLIDEVLAVGDAAFQQKCFEEFERIKRSNSTVLFVTHDMGSVQRFCDRALLLEHGRIVEIGEPQRVGMRYLTLNFSEEARAREADREREDSTDVAPTEVEEEPSRVGDRRAEVVQAWFEDDRGARAEVLEHGRRCAFVLKARFNADVEDPVFGVSLQNSSDDTVFAASTQRSDPHLGQFKQGDEVTVRITFENWLAGDRYHATPAIARLGSGLDWLDWREKLVPVVVAETDASGALVALPFEASIERSARSVVAT